MTRDAVLGAVRRALGPRERSPGVSDWTFPSTAEDDLVSRFVAEATLVGCEVVLSDEDWWSALRPFVPDHDAVLVGPDVDAAATGLAVVDPAEAARRPAAVLGIVRGDWGVAESGSVLIEQDGAHAPSLFTETAAMVLDRRDIVAGLEALPPPSPAVRARILVTGPSRTADIEKRLVLGAHGPKRVIVVVV